MKKSIIVTFLFAISVLSFSQTNVKKIETSVGTNTSSGKSIPGIRYEFSNQIAENKLDTTNQLLTLRLGGGKNNLFSKTRQLLVFDLKSKKVKWSQEINLKSLNILQNKDLLLLDNGVGVTTRISTIDGRKLWETERVFFATIPTLNIGLGYPYKKGTNALSDILSGVDLTTGKTLWERKVDKSFGWDGFVVLNDSIVIVKSSGLHQINIKTGQGWDYNAITGIKGYSRKQLDNAASEGINMMIGNEVVKQGYDLFNHFTSNLAENKSNYFYASKNAIVSISKKNGDVNWKYELPDETSRSNIFIKGNTVYLINEGAASYNNSKMNYGKPYIAGFDLQNGKKLFLTFLNTKSNPVLEYLPKESEIDILFADRICRISMQDGTLEKTFRYKSLQNEVLKNIYDDKKAYIMENNTLSPLNLYNPKGMYIMDTQNNIIQFDSNYNPVKRINQEDIFLLLAETEKYTFLFNNKVIVIDKQGKKIAELSMNNNIFILGGKLYQISLRGIVEVDLKNLDSTL